MYLSTLENILIPLGICVAMPVLIVYFVSRARQNETNRRTEVMLKAIENGAPIDPELFKSPKKDKKARSHKEKLLDHLTGACVTGFIGVAVLAYGIWKGCLGGWDAGDKMCILIAAILIAIGIANLVVYILGMKMFAKEIELEEKQSSEGEK